MQTIKQKKRQLFVKIYFATVVLSKEQNVTVYKTKPPTGYTIHPDANRL